MNEKEITLNKRCKETLYLKKHKCIRYPGLGYRCKYCGKSLYSLQLQEIQETEK